MNSGVLAKRKDYAPSPVALSPMALFRCTTSPLSPPTYHAILPVILSERTRLVRTHLTCSHDAVVSVRRQYSWGYPAAVKHACLKNESAGRVRSSVKGAMAGRAAEPLSLLLEGGYRNDRGGVNAGIGFQRRETFRVAAKRGGFGTQGRGGVGGDERRREIWIPSFGRKLTRIMEYGILDQHAKTTLPLWRNSYRANGADMGVQSYPVAGLSAVQLLFAIWPESVETGTKMVLGQRHAAQTPRTQGDSAR
ncbi:unnamed protein product [Diplocarpon coronariae]